ncbi:MAG: SDR family oxidoreductase [Deltaproteobacteria bacterium]|nr:SDR family oxidoreductase [Deltaproteobacteria bacterium]
MNTKKLAKAFGGKSFIITGAAGGLGSCMARLLAPHWSSALLLDMNEAGLAQIAGELAGRSAGAIATRTVDLTSEKSIDDALKDLPSGLNPPDVLVNNAGVSIMRLAGSQPLSEYRMMMEVNYFAVVNLVNRFLPAMLSRRSGRILTIASGSGVLANYGGSAYCGSKFATVGFMEALRQELAGTGVKANCVLLPTVMTDFHRKVLGGEFGDMAKGLPTITPEAAAAELLSQAAGNREIIAFTPTLKAGLIANGVAPAVLRLAMTLNGYMLNKKRGRAPLSLLSRG